MRLPGYRRRPLLPTAAAAVALIAMVAACGSDDSAPPAGTSSPSSVGETAFPVVIKHGQGETEIPAAPERVITLSWTDTQIANALDAPIVAAARNPDSPDGNWPGMATPLDDDVLTLDSVTPNLEAIASHQPDLILMTAAQPGFTEMYDKLSDIAPTVSYQTELLQDDGDELAAMIGTALGKTSEADRLIASSAEAIKEFKAQLPGLDGARVVFAQNYQQSTGVIVTEDTPVVRFLRRLGFRVPAELRDLAGDDAALGTVQLSDENLHLLDTADAAFINTPDGEDAFAELPTVKGLDLTTNGTLFFTGNELAGLLLTPNPATTELLLEQLQEPLTHLAAQRKKQS